MRCVIVDDNAQFLQAARELLERQGVQVVGLASSCDEALARARELRPDVTLVDVDLGGESGFDVAKALVTELSPEPPEVVLISTYAERDFAELIAASPAVGFLSKSNLSGAALADLLSARPGT